MAKFFQLSKPSEPEVWINPSIVIFINDPTGGSLETCLVAEQFRSMVAPCEKLVALTLGKAGYARKQPITESVGRLLVNPQFVLKICSQAGTGHGAGQLTTIELATGDTNKSFDVKGEIKKIAEDLGIILASCPEPLPALGRGVADADNTCGLLGGNNWLI